MTVYISLLRGINVGGKAQIKMQELKALYADLGFQAVKTYVQSGNVVFGSGDPDGNKIVAQIAGKINSTFQLDVKVIVRTAGEWRRIIGENPFLKEEAIDTDKLHVTLLADEPDQAKLGIFSGLTDPVDRFSIKGKEIYLYCPQGYGRTKLNNDFFEKKTGLPATTRNWRTMKTLMEMADSRNSQP